MKNLILIVTMLTGYFIHYGDCGCRSVLDTETTHLGGNQLIRRIERKPLSVLNGVVLDENDEPIAGALVEVFDKPEWIVDDLNESKVKQSRVKACKTGKDGSFCFAHLSTGRYELRISKDERFNPTHTYIEVDTDVQDPHETPLEVTLTLGT